ncbi:hypothetical protein QZH41_018100 [Actinostola sp. cb2023]|nr:hypothetical protein QZH41_018100 [Actinostola sp. cb2023]
MAAKALPQVTHQRHVRFRRVFFFFDFFGFLVNSQDFEVTAASKFLTLQESVRDAADLYLSLKHYPLVFLCDTACGFVRHMDCRVPELTDKIWGKFCGCFEEPKLGVSPNKGMNVPIITTAEYRDREAPMFESSDSTVHPLSGESRRYVLGDRFHNASNPHKSPLCLYHDINLAEQSNAIKTSYQESENNRKNVRRLRSSCVQSFDTHFIYNFLMDYYQNQEIVTEQYRIASMNLKDGQKVVRDSYMRFVIQN